MLVIVLAFGMTAVGCEDDLIPDPKLNGTWVRENSGGSQTYKFNNGSYESEQSISNTYFSGPYYRSKGTYTTGDNKINWGGGTYEYNGAYFVAIRNSLGANAPAMYSNFVDRWYSQKDYEDIMRPYQQPTTSTETYTSVTTYEVEDNTLTLTYTSTRDSDGYVTTSSITYTRK